MTKLELLIAILNLLSTILELLSQLAR